MAKKQYSIDDFLGGRVRLKQPVEGLRVTSDAVLLSAVCNPKKNEMVLDVGCAGGVVALCVGARAEIRDTKYETRHKKNSSLRTASGARVLDAGTELKESTLSIHLTGLEIQPELAELARENAELNNQNMLVIEGDLTQKIPVLSGQTFHHVVTNPPFYNEDPQRANASQNLAYKESVPLKTWIGFCLKHLRPRGTFSIIHRPEAVPEILSLLSPKLGGIVLIPVWPKPDATPKRVIIQGILESKKPFRLHPGITLYNADNTRTDAAEDVMRNGKKIKI